MESGKESAHNNQESNHQESNQECPICMENTVDCFIYPCMHEICKKCSDKLRSIGNKKCHYCRGEVEDIINAKDGSVIPKPPLIPGIPIHLNLGNTENMGPGISYSYQVVFFSNVQFHINNN